MSTLCLTRGSKIAGAVELELSANQSKLLHNWALWVSCGQILGLYNFEISGFAVDFQLTKISNRHWLSTPDPLTLLTFFSRCIRPRLPLSIANLTPNPTLPTPLTSLTT